MKICFRCRISKEESEFFRDKTKKDGLNPSCKPCVKPSFKASYERNRGAILARQKEYCRKNRQRKAKTDREYRLNNLAHVKEVQRGYRIRNMERISEDRRLRYRVDPSFRISVNLRNRLNAVLKGRRKTKSTLELLGCTAAEAKKYLESLFVGGMTWENHGEWHIDHKKPLQGGGVNLDDPKQLAELCHYTNLQPLWGAENISKSNRTV